MEKKEKRCFNAAAILTLPLMLSTFMGFSGTLSSSGGFSFFAAVCILNFLALVSLCVALFRKKKNLHLGLSLGANALVSLLTVCFFFSWQEFFICLTLSGLTLCAFWEPRKHRKGITFGISLSAAAILLVTLLSFAGNFRRTGGVLDLQKWLYYFSPFLFALLYGALGNLLAPALCGRGSAGAGKLALIPVLLLALIAILTAILSAVGAASEPLLLLSGILAALAILVYPFLLLFAGSGKQPS